MKQTYEKPYARNLGDVIPNAEGYCWNGSHANYSDHTDCTDGASAVGGICARGGQPSRQGCDTGTIPAYIGCSEGGKAQTGHCNTGTKQIP